MVDRVRLVIMSLTACLLLSAWNVSPVQAKGLRAQGSETSATVTGSVVNVRAGPGTGYTIIGQVRRGDGLSVSGRNSSSTWWQVCCVNGRTGWIYGQLISISGSTAGIPVTAAPSAAPTPAPPSPVGWRGEYYANRDLSGSPAFVRYDPQINFRWNGASPGGGVPGSNFSVRWTQTVNLAAGDYTFYTQVDDGVRLYIDNILLINQWQERSITSYANTFTGLGAGNHRITVEYFQAAGDSAAVVWWETANQFPQWKGEYYDDIYLQGPPLLVRNDPDISFNWGLGSPDPRVPADNFSVRWTRRLHFERGHYAFHANTSDGVRVYVDGHKVIDEWHDTTSGYPTYTGIFYELSAGLHVVVVEYYERGGIAYATVYWNSLGKSVPQ